MCIIGSVDSICRGSVDMRYMIISQLVSLYDVRFIFECFMTYNTPSRVKKHNESTEPKSCKMAKMCVSSSSPFSSDGLVQNVWLSRWFSHKTIAFYTEQYSKPSLFHNFEASWGGSNQSLRNYAFISDAIFKKTCMHVRIQDSWIRNMVVVFGIHCPGQWFFSQYCIHLLRKPRGQTCCSVVDGKLQNSLQQPF